MSPDLIERILRCPTLPTLPAVAMRVLELTQNKDVSLDQLAAEIQNDQALSAKILKTINSSFYGLRKPCTTISQAMVMLGLSAVKSLALSFSLVSSLGSADDEFDHVAYWRRGLYTASAAKTIAREAGRQFEDEAFLGGLFQDLGMQALYQGLGQPYLRVIVAAGDHRNLVRQELGSLEAQHPDIGALLAQRWKLPPDLVAPVKYHERPTAAPPEYATLVRCVSLGNTVHDVLTDEHPAEAMRTFRARAAKWFGFEPASCDDMLRRIAESTLQLSSLFHLDTGSTPDPEQIIERAQDHLAQINEQSFRDATAASSELRAVLADGDEYDPLTGALGAEAGAAHAESEFERARGARRALTILKVGVDNFRAVVDRHGVEAGDAVLFETASVLQKQFQGRGGSISRAHESAFEVVVPGLDRLGAVKAAAALRELINRQSTSWGLGGAGASAERLTTSVGVATMEPAWAAQFARVQQLQTAGERALEAAQRCGGDCIRAFVPKTVNT
jgi:two-component system cell cycle response regulator